MQVAAIVQPLDLAEFLFGMCVKVTALAPYRVGKKNFGGQAGFTNAGVPKKFGTLRKRRPEVQTTYAAAPSLCSFSA